jgi:hypothetical protein
MEATGSEPDVPSTTSTWACGAPSGNLLRVPHLAGVADTDADADASRPEHAVTSSTPRGADELSLRDPSPPV